MQEEPRAIFVEFPLSFLSSFDTALALLKFVFMTSSGVNLTPETETASLALGAGLVSTTGGGAFPASSLRISAMLFSQIGRAHV